MGLLVSVPLGPVGVMCIQRTINRGLKSGVFSGLGAASADLFYALIAGFGLSYIINFIEARQTIIQVIGSIIIVIVAFKIFYTNPAVQLRKHRNKKGKAFEEILSIFIVTLSNPAVFFAFLAMFAAFNVINSSYGHLGTITTIVGIFTGSMLWWYVLSAIINHFRTKIRLKNLWWLNKIMGVIVFLCGIIALADVLIRMVINNK
ncbi:MAG TPA: LysE family transporter [Bacteroidales bacterium]|nr:LysE family transporter [Bacteroidales bacterium]